MSTSPTGAAPTLPPGEEERLAAVRGLGVLDTPAEERFDRITRLAQRLFGVQSALVTVVDDNRQWFKSRQGLATEETPRSWAFCDRAIRSPETMVVPDAQADERFQANPLVTGDPNIRFYAGKPLEVPGGHRVGTLCILDNSPREFNEAERETLEDLAAAAQKELLVNAEFDRAAEVQQALLPREAPTLDGYQLAGTCLPARSVGGDFFDWHPVYSSGGQPDGVGFTLADVMGKGIGAAILMATVRAVLRATGRQPDVAAALATAAASLEDDLDETGTFVTLFHARLLAGDHVLQCVDAGHGLTLLVRADGSTRRVASRGLPVGALPGTTWEPVTVPLEPGDTLVSVSDGFLDLTGGTVEGLDRLTRIARSATGARDLVDRIRAATRGRPLPDDVTAVALSRAGA